MRALLALMLVALAWASDSVLPLPASLTYASSSYLYINNTLSGNGKLYGNGTNGMALALPLNGSNVLFAVQDATCDVHLMNVDGATGTAVWEYYFDAGFGSAQKDCLNLKDWIQTDPSAASVLIYSPSGGIVVNFVVLSTLTGAPLLASNTSQIGINITPFPQTVNYALGSGPIIIVQSLNVTIVPNKGTLCLYGDMAYDVNGTVLWEKGRSLTSPIIYAMVMSTASGEVYVAYSYLEPYGTLHAALTNTGELLWEKDVTFYTYYPYNDQPQLWELDNGQLAVLAYIAGPNDLEVVSVDALTGLYTSRCSVIGWVTGIKNFLFSFVGDTFIVITNGSSATPYVRPPLYYFVYRQNCTSPAWSPIDLSDIDIGYGDVIDNDFRGTQPSSITFMNDTMMVVTYLNASFVVTLPPPSKSAEKNVQMMVGIPWEVTKFVLNPTGENEVACKNSVGLVVDAQGTIRLPAYCSYPIYAALLQPVIPISKITWQGAVAIACLLINVLCIACLLITGHRNKKSGYSSINDDSSSSSYRGPPAIVVRPAAICSVATFVTCMVLSFTVLMSAEEQVRTYGNVLSDPMSFYNTSIVPCSGNTTAYPPQSACFCSNTLNSSSTGASFEAVMCSPEAYSGPCASIFQAECACDMAFFQYSCPCQLSLQVSDCSQCTPQLSRTINTAVAKQISACSSAFSSTTNLLVTCLALQLIYLLWLTVQAVYQLKTGEEKWDKVGTGLAVLHTLLNMILWGIAVDKLGVLSTLSPGSYCTNKIMDLLPGCHFTGAYVNADLENQALVALGAAALLALPKPALSCMHCCSSSCHCCVC